MLHPQLQSYFGAIPPGHVGVGEGVFAEVGAPRRWVRGLIRMLVPGDVLFPVWEREVGFRIRNTPATMQGTAALRGERVFLLRGGERVMRDLILAGPDGLDDVLGAAERFTARFQAIVADGVLTLRSERVWLRLGRRRIRVPAPLAPRIALREEAGYAGRQRVDVSVVLPVLGPVYGYRGSFRYRLVPEDQES